MATRLLLRSFRFRRPAPPPRSASSSQLGDAQTPHHLLHHSPPPPVPHTQHVRHLHVPPTGVLGNIRWFRGGSRYSSSSKAASAGRHILANMLSASIVSASAGNLSNQKSPPKEKENEKGPHNHENRLCTNALIAVNVLIHVVDVATNRKLAVGAANGSSLYLLPHDPHISHKNKVNDLVREGQIWRMATASLLRTDWAHLICNMRILNEFGPMLEGYTGPRRFLTIYCSSALSGSLFSNWFTPGAFVDASDAICGLIGAQAVYSWRHRETLKKTDETLANIALLVVSNLVIALFTKHRTDHWAHLGGLLGGAAVECFLGTDEKQCVAAGGVVVIKDKPPTWFSN